MLTSQTSEPGKLVAHRGLPCHFPENSLIGFSSVLEAGVKFVETDINMTTDGVAVLSHDDNLKRLTGMDMSITQADFSSFENLPAGFPDRFGQQFSDSRIATLNQFTDLLVNWPDVHCFIELKRASLKCFGQKFVDTVTGTINRIGHQATIISFDYEALVYIRQSTNYPIGWVLPEWSDKNHDKAMSLSPDYLFVGTGKCPQVKSNLWTSNWQWVIYTVNTPVQYRKYCSLEFDLIETDCYDTLTAALREA